MQISKLEIRPYIDLVLRRKWWVIVPFLLVVFGGVSFLAVWPKSYMASTLILLEPQSIPDAFVRSTVTEAIEGRLRTITQQIHSRTNLEKIIQDFHIGPEPYEVRAQEIIRKLRNIIRHYITRGPTEGQTTKNEQVALMNLVGEMRKRIRVMTRGGSGGSGGPGREQSQAFEISFEWHDQEVVAPVTNAIAARFIEENINAREERAINTTDFLEKETTILKAELEAKEKELEAFKRENMGMLPDQLASNISILNQLREQVISLERRLDQEQQQALLAAAQAGTQRVGDGPGRSSATVGEGRPPGSLHEARMTSQQLISGSLEELEAELKRLSTLYTEKHPDVIALKRRIDALRAQEEPHGAIPGGGHTSHSHDRTAVQLATINANIESYKKEIQETEKQIQNYKQRVESIPQVEMELNKLLRGYETIRERYDGLLSKKLDAKLAEQMEKRKKGEQFRVLDPAVKPPKPSKPNSIKIMAMVLALGVGMGGGLAYLREALDPRFYNAEQVQSLLDVKVIVSLPIVKAQGRS